ncbi:substrate-binding periplasmic protein [Chitinimonas taiwanensis]|uniref:Polar amino acid transport system substrate-binding protein n=1 Tax=Chitinimonas taiwanensis DSM 18899 TaxID=1121279 RepID=A0A1K2HIU8_9NEIS|nr:transporter substrate-binding domain-containing protein [Chitinimonas taiwanensis]SFZ76687.1 polar amino acid transport system substrate-binding protein [Chitinimonas taiwanensis DSM 18899]
MPPYPAALFACVALCMSTPALALRFVTEDYPPFNMLEENQVSGISTLILREALSRAQLSAEFELLPWARALAMARSQPQTCVYSAVRSAEREKQGHKWVGPLVDDRISLFARVDSKIKLRTLGEARNYRVGGYVADAYGDYVERQGVRLDRAPADLMNLPKLMAGRIDLWVAGSISGAYKAKREGYQHDVKLLLSGGEPRDSQMWLACNRAVPDALISSLNEAVKSVHADGTAARFAARYH